MYQPKRLKPYETWGSEALSTLVMNRLLSIYLAFQCLNLMNLSTRYRLQKLYEIA